MALEDNKGVGRRFFEELVGAGHWALLEALVAPNAVHVASTRWAPGREGFRQHITWFRNAYPDMHVTVDDLIAEGDRVIAFWTMRGTHQGQCFGVQPTGRHVVLNAISTLRVLNGQVCEYEARPDYLGILLQLGSLGRYTDQLAHPTTT
jgi:predicted ester cyclase